MRDRLERSGQLAGVNPLFLYRQEAFGQSASLTESHISPQSRIAHMGSVGNCLGQLQYLYEGLDVYKRQVFGCYGIFALEDWNSFVTKPFAVAEQEVQPLTGRLRR